VTPGALLTGTWTFTGIYATNTAATTGGRFTGGGNVPTLTGWAPGATNTYAVVGWNAGLGAFWPEVAAKLANNWAGVGAGVYFGISGLGFGAAGGGASGLPPLSLFGPQPTGQGTPIPTGFTYS